MNIVATNVPNAFVDGPERNRILGIATDSVHVRTIRDNCSGLTAAKNTNDAVSTDTGLDLESKLRQIIGHDSRSSTLVARYFRMLMQVTPKRDQLILRLLERDTNSFQNIVGLCIGLLLSNQ